MLLKNKMLIEDMSGNNGVDFLIKEFNNIDFRLFSHSDKKKETEFIENNKKYYIN